MSLFDSYKTRRPITRIQVKKAVKKQDTGVRNIVIKGFALNKFVLQKKKKIFNIYVV